MKKVFILLIGTIFIVLNGCTSSTNFEFGEVNLKSGTYIRYHKGKKEHPYTLEIKSDSTVRLTQWTNISTVGTIGVENGGLRIMTEKPLYHVWEIIKSDENGFYDHFNDDQWVLQ